ncbi:hypothetical protein NA57DRAFT_51671 [Rhizodiscina lignyota]|uniref:Uncharacterized protein n=1 Tax=Rhizodiscina lignyota TaxID=1504668 RepID=A0A9P4MEX0_9PEZI|nr:hypothetical protein NA57DRAFT_51671 [Rhizodiscina lignyota]
MESFFSSPVYYPLPSRTLSTINTASRSSTSSQTETEPLMAHAPDFAYTDGEFASVACLADIDNAIITTASPYARRQSSRSLPPSYDDPYDELDLEQKSKHTLPRLRSRGWYQRTLWHLSNKPMESWMAFAAVMLALVALVALIFLVFVLAMQSTGHMGAVYKSVDRSITSFHSGVMNVMCVLAGPDCPTEL